MSAGNIARYLLIGALSISAFVYSGCVGLDATSTTGIAKEPEHHLIWPSGKIPDSGHPEPYEPYYIWWEAPNRTTDAIMICCSGGGYWGCATGQFETLPLIKYLNEKGMTCVEFKYRPRPEKDKYPKHLAAWQDAQRLIRIVRREARNRGWDTERIGFSGGSAGGHLTIMAAVSSTSNSYERVDEIDDESCHVNFAVPVYPAYGMSDNPDGCSRNYDIATELVPEFLFDAKTPPMCFFHGYDDGWTPLTSWRCWFKMRQIGIPCELHMLANEGHCFQYRPRPGTNAEQWKDILWAWLTRMEFVTKHPYQYYSRNMKFEGRAWEYPMRGPLENICENYITNSWRSDGMCGAFYPVTDNVDITMKQPVKGNYELDFEFEIYGDAKYAAIGICGWEVRFPAGEFKKATPQRVTLWKRPAKDGIITGIVNSQPIPSSWIRKADDVPEDRVVFRGKNGNGYGKFHMVRMRRFTDSLYGAGALPATTPARCWDGPEKEGYEKHPAYMMHLKKMASVTNGVTRTVFLGDSIIANWSALPVENAVNLGYGGNQTSHVIWRITEGGELDGYEADRVVLLIGTNNTGHNPVYREYPADTASGIGEIIRIIKEKQPRAKIILCAILPRGEKSGDPLRVRNEKVNEWIRGFADGKTVVWCDVRAEMLEEDGTLPRSVCPDFLHPNAEGYSRIAAKLVPLLESGN